MNIAFCTEYLMPQINGIAVRCDEYIKHLKKNNHNIDVYGPKNHTFTDVNIHTITNYWNKGNRLTILPNIKLLVNIFLKKYDVVHIVLPLFAWFPLIALITKMSGTKLILSNHVNLTYYSKSYFKSKIIIRICKLIIIGYYRFQNLIADLIMAPSNFDETQAYINPEKFRILKTGIDMKLFTPQEKIKINREIIYVGRIAPEKKLDKLFSLFLQMKGYKLTIIGDGPELPRLKVMYASNPNIEFKGFVKHNELTPYYKNADFHLVSSLSETFGFTLIESMACGTPVIYPRCGVFDSLYGNSFPELCYDFDKDSTFLKAVENFNSNYKELSSRSIDYASRQSWDAATKDLVKNYYLQLVKPKTKSKIYGILFPKYFSYLMVLVYFGFCASRYIKN